MATKRKRAKLKRNPARKLKGKSTTLKNMASVTIQKLPNGVVKITGRKMAGKGRKSNPGGRRVEVWPDRTSEPGKLYWIVSLEDLDRETSSTKADYPGTAAGHREALAHGRRYAKELSIGFKARKR